MSKPVSTFDCSGYAQGIAQVLSLKEADLPRYLHGTGLPPEVLYDGSGLHMDVTQFLTVIRNGQQLLGDPEMGLRCGQNLQRSVHGPIGYLAMNAPDLYTALLTPAEFAPIRLPLVNTELSFTQDELRCELQVMPKVESEVQQLILEAFALTVQTNVELYLGEAMASARFEFAFPSPAHAAAYADYFHCPVTFDAACSALFLPAEVARRSHPNRDPHAYATAHALCQELLARLPDASLDIVDKVRRELLSNALSETSEEDVARALFVSKRTLARRLTERGTSYRTVRESLLAELSARYLRDDSMTVEAIALLLGYHDAANFRRAFKRWHRVAPAEFRKRFS